MENGEVKPETKIDISILLPTRGRAHRLESAIGSLLAKAAYPSKLELMLWHDNDDEPTINFADQFIARMLDESPRPCGALWNHCGKRIGYSRLFAAYNEMALRASGRFVLLWNDDTDMVADEWDRLLIGRAEATPHIPLVQFLRRDCYQQADTTLPFIDKRIVDELQGISKHMYTDTWIGEVAAMSETLVWRNDVPYAHHWPMQDATMREGVEDIRKSGEHETFKARVGERQEEAKKVRALVERLGGGQ